MKMRFIGYKLFILLTFIDVDLNFLFNFKYKQLHKHRSRYDWYILNVYFIKHKNIFR